MTTETPTTHLARTTPRGAELVGAGLVALGVSVLVALLATLATGPAAGVGAMAGGSIALVFFLAGSVLVGAVAASQPQLAMLVALLTYTLEVLLLLVVFVALDRAEVFPTAAERGWVVAGLLGCTLAWTAGHIRATTRLRIPAFEGSRSRTREQTVSGS
ncbi:hypothetical protein GCM10011519_13360 [Marmoricola endophyticus]|uniref:ATP synthase protein I n=1 Tax=Marmoricola endophyticus TaxID=2040280 RepID=A0A917BI41_9ACTN|nr:hypothetical protein [Marmoricola endophyticus]GGF40991.1 hypothetical protein GCM10011519_13360 [Marmoricola endophyticus]